MVVTKIQGRKKYEPHGATEKWILVLRITGKFSESGATRILEDIFECSILKWAPKNAAQLIFV